MHPAHHAPSLRGHLDHKVHRGREVHKAYKERQEHRGSKDSKVTPDHKADFLKELKKQMIKQANLLEFEKAALIRDRIKELEDSEESKDSSDLQAEPEEED